MKRWRSISVVLLMFLIALGSIGYLNHTSLMLAYIKNFTHPDVAANRFIEWAQGPAEALNPPAQHAPNIIFILADDLGINDISTFGGGVAGGRAPTPNID